jgi:hypothetical protein
MWLVHETQSPKYPKEERADEMTVVVEHLPSKQEVLRSNFITATHSPKSLETQSPL